MSREEPTALVLALVGGSHFVNHAYFMLLPPIFGALRADLGITTAQSGLALGLVGAVVVVLQLPFGHHSDAYSRALVLGISLSVGAVGAFLTATATGYPTLLLAALVTGVGIAGHHPAHYPMLSAATTPDARGRAYSIHGFAGALGFALPPAVVGVAAAVGVGWRAAIGAIALLGGGYAVGCLWLVRERVPESVTRSPGSDDASRPSLRALPGRLLAGVRSMLGATAILLLTALWFVTSMANWGVQAYTATLLVDGYAVAQGTANLAVSAMLVIGALAILLGGRLSDSVGARAVLLGGFLALVGMAAALASGALPVAAAIGVALLLASTVKAGRPALSKLGDALSARDDLGKNFGLLTIGISGGGAVAPPVFGTLSDVASIETVFLAIAGLGVVCLLGTVIVLRAGERHLNRA